MDRRRFLVIAGAATSITLAAPARTFAATGSVARVSVIRWPREILMGTPGACAGSRPSRTALTMERMLSTR